MYGLEIAEQLVIGLAAVEQRDGVAAPKQFAHHVRADEAGAAEYEHVERRLCFPLAVAGRRGRACDYRRAAEHTGPDQVSARHRHDIRSSSFRRDSLPQPVRRGSGTFADARAAKSSPNLVRLNNLVKGLGDFGEFIAVGLPIPFLD